MLIEILAGWCAISFPAGVFVGHLIGWSDGRRAGEDVRESVFINPVRSLSEGLRLTAGGRAPRSGSVQAPLRGAALSDAGSARPDNLVQFPVPPFPRRDNWHGKVDLDRHSSCQSLIRRAFPAHAAKRLAAALDVPIETARNFVHRSVPVSRAPQIAAALLPELERQRAEIEETIEQTRRLLAELNGGKG